MNEVPYSKLPDHAFWRRSVEAIHPTSVDPVVSAVFKIDRENKVATAGSCFAQHIARYLHKSGFNYYVSEPAHPIASKKLEKEFGYGEFTARYGNIYTSRQLLQLFERAYGEKTPQESIWKNFDGGFSDPFRPNIQPGGFDSVLELQVDREQHFAAVRKAFENLDVFVFTLGLTETWVSKEDGMAFPLCPGVVAGTFDSEKFCFTNLSVADVVSDLSCFIHKLRGVNPTSKVILTVSPVPLIATMEDRHVLSSTTYSKSVLRVAADEVSRAFENVAYFPSYEIITGSFSRGRYFASDCRSVLENGVKHVMELFLKHYTDAEADQPPEVGPEEISRFDAYLAKMDELVEVNCDEVFLDDLPR